MSQPGLVVRLCEWEAKSSIAVLDLDYKRVYNEPSRFIKWSRFCMVSQRTVDLYNELSGNVVQNLSPVNEKL